MVGRSYASPSRRSAPRETPYISRDRSVSTRKAPDQKIADGRPGIKPSKPSGGSARARLGGLHAQFGLLGGVTLSLGLGSAELNRAARLRALGGVRAAECATAHPWLLIG